MTDKIPYAVDGERFRENLYDRFEEAINTYKLIQDGDKIAVCISGGKDSMLMALLFLAYKKHSKTPFDLEFLVMDPGYNEINRRTIEQNAEKLGVPIKVFETTIFDAVYDIEKSPCYICARMRRGHLYSSAKKLGCNKIALGHHYDDVIETILMGMLYGAQLQTMMPKLHSTNFEGMELIRPMYLISEKDIIEWRTCNSLNFIQCACRFTENIAVNTDGAADSKRSEVKNLIQELQKEIPDVRENIFKSVQDVDLEKILSYGM